MNLPVEFSREVRTFYDDHRVVLICRDGFPTKNMWGQARVLVKGLLRFPRARLVAIHSDCGTSLRIFYVYTPSEKEFKNLLQNWPPNQARHSYDSEIKIHIEYVPIPMDVRYSDTACFFAEYHFDKFRF